MPEVGRGAREFSGEQLREIAFPLGGIGTGTVSLGGRGDLRDWEIFNRPGKGRLLPYSFFALWARRPGESPIARVLERRFLPPYTGGSGLPTARLSGLPRLGEALFRGGYPLAEIDFADDALPARVSLQAFNPLIPLDDRNSGIPAALFLWRVRNSGEADLEISIAFSLFNACGYDGIAPLHNRFHPLFGSNLNEFADEDDLRGIRMSGGKYACDHAQFGTMAAATWARDVTFRTRWERAGWWDDAQDFWDGFVSSGRLPNGPDPEPSPDGQTDVGSIAAHVTLEPGSETEIPFALCWHFPNLTNYWNSEESVKGQRVGNWYATQWADAWEAARYVRSRFDELREGTSLFHEALFGGTLPPEALDAASANISTLRTTTCLRTEDGRFNAFEGCNDDRGCCPMNCTHVWNYAQTAAYLFPKLEQSARRTDFTHNTRSCGDMAFRTLLPLIGELWAFKPAADGQMGAILRVYREWLISGDRAFLEEMWPGVERALEFAWREGGWDPRCCGVMEGEQHNTYDIEFYGPNTLTGTWYLGALRAAEEMARSLGRHAQAAKYREVFESGSTKYSTELWNGEYFVQRIVPPVAADTRGVGGASHPASVQAGEAQPRYQYGAGCLSDHLLGQWFAHVVGLGYLLPREQVRSAVAAIHRHNFRRDLSDHTTVQRVYALNDEAGLLLCTWPNGGRPRYPFPYADEVWTGIEYQVAAHLIYEGLVEEGLEIVRAVRNRHDGAKRNPWDEPECGHHYARALSSWSLILALSGFECDLASERITFGPRISSQQFRGFFSTGSAWGVYSQSEDGGFRAEIRVLWGELRLRAIRLTIGAFDRISASLGAQRVAIDWETDAGGRFRQPLLLRPGNVLEVWTG